MTATAKRLNLRVNGQVDARLQRLKKMAGASSITEVIRYALAVFDTVLTLRQNGFDLFAEKGSDRQRLVLIPPLDVSAAAPQGHAEDRSSDTRPSTKEDFLRGLELRLERDKKALKELEQQLHTEKERKSRVARRAAK